ncbi:MAG TPA: TonB-dependent receptor, partial [Steroidobacteraceae bacterium]
HEGIATCIAGSGPFHGAPCVDLNGRSADAGNSPKLNLTYKFDPNHMIYATWSRGFRPGGVNRNGGGTEPPYKADFLTNYELGWKTTWFDHRLRVNGDVFWENWKDFQFSFLGPNALTIIANAGEARIKGLESDLEYAVTEGLTLSSGFAWTDAKLSQQYCVDLTQCGVPGYEQFAPSGTQLPITPKFKGNVTARYSFAMASGWKANLQASAVYVGPRWADLRLVAREDLGEMPSYTIADFSAGVEKHGMTAELFISNAFDERAVLARFSECDVSLCGQIAKYDLPNQPRTIGLRFGQKF